MTQQFDGLAFSPADVLLPQNCAYGKWSVVACDQYTSQPEYWQRVEETVGAAPSALRLILPESCLDGPNVETDIVEVNNTMTRYLREGCFRELPESLIYVERRLSNGRLRRGLVGKVDLEQYDYEPGAAAQVRATEGTVLSRIPPRVAVRKNAPLELPHVMLLADDPNETVIEPLGAQTGEMELLYDFELMEQGGHIKGWRLGGKQMEQVARAMAALAPAEFDRAVVCSPYPQILAAGERFGFLPLYNGGAAEGISASIRLGLARMSDLDGVLFAVCDQPSLTTKSIIRLKKSFLESPDAIYALSWQGRRGNPVVFPADLFGELAALTGDTGGGAVIRRHPERLRLVEAFSPNELLDVDNPEALS